MEIYYSSLFFDLGGAVVTHKILDVCCSTADDISHVVGIYLFIRKNGVQVLHCTNKRFKHKIFTSFK